MALRLVKRRAVTRCNVRHIWKSSNREVPMVPSSLRTWFVIHFLADVLFALPLFLAPRWTLSLLGWPAVDKWQREEHEKWRSEEHTSELQSPCNLVCRLLLEKKKKKKAMQ